jgi:site-specific DNA recombinase
MSSEQNPSRLRVVIYARQSVKEEQGIQQQLDDCRVEAKHRGWLVVEEYKDDGTSGSKERGPKTDWARMLKAFDAGQFDALLANDVDRITRSLTDVLEVRPPKRDIRVLTVRGGIDTSDSTGDYLLKQLVILAEREVKLKGDRAQRYSVERRKAGHPTPGKTPHGYHWVPAIDRDDAGTRYRIDGDEAQDVRVIFSEFLAGAPLGQIARDLNNAGRRTRADAKGVAFKWHTSTVRRVLMNPAYAALLPPAQPTGEFDTAKISLEECAPGAWEPIIDVDVVTTTRNRLLGVKPNHSGTARKWLLAGLAVCSVCREPVRSARGETHPTARVDGTGKADSKRYHAYRCVSSHFMRNGDIVDDYIKEVCIARLSKPDLRELLSPRTDAVDVSMLHSHRIDLLGRESTIATMIATGKMKPKAAEQALDDLASEIRAVNDEIARAIKHDPLAELVGVDDVREWWDAATLARRRSVIEVLMMVAIRPVGYGRRVTDLNGASLTVGVEWKGKVSATA